MAAWGLLVTSWLFYGLNCAFFHFGWPWNYLLNWPPQFAAMIDFVSDPQPMGRPHAQRVDLCVICVLFNRSGTVGVWCRPGDRRTTRLWKRRDGS